jgi:hypothetical protein
MGPWEVSPQDALIAGLGVVATDSVGSCQYLLRRDLRRCLVPVGNTEIAAARMGELVEAGAGTVHEMFAPARSIASEFTVRETCRRLLSIAGLGRTAEQ